MRDVGNEDVGVATGTKVTAVLSGAADVATASPCTGM
jgi:hypothetical protein